MRKPNIFLVQFSIAIVKSLKTNYNNLDNNLKMRSLKKLINYAKFILNKNLHPLLDVMI